MSRLCVWGISARKTTSAAQAVAMAQTLGSAVPGVDLTLISAKQGESLKGILGRHGVQVSTVSSRNLVSVAQALAKSDGLMITGAPFLESPYQGAGALAIVTLAKALGLPVLGYGISLFEYRTWWGKRLYRALLNRIDRITVREPVARDILTSLGVRAPVDLFADFRFTLEPPPRETVRPLLAQAGIDPEAPIIGVTPRLMHKGLPGWVKHTHHHECQTERKYHEAFAYACARVTKFGQLVYLPLHREGREDAAMLEILRGPLPDPAALRVLKQGLEPLQLLGIIGACDLMVTSRLGSATLAAVVATPTVAVAVEPRMADHMSAVGLGPYVLDWRGVTAEDLVSRIEAAWAERANTRRALTACAQELRGLAWRNAEVAAAFFGGSHEVKRQHAAPA